MKKAGGEETRRRQISGKSSAPIYDLRIPLRAHGGFVGFASFVHGKVHGEWGE